MATGSADKSVRIWSLENLYPIRIAAGHTKDVNVSFITCFCIFVCITNLATSN